LTSAKELLPAEKNPGKFKKISQGHNPISVDASLRSNPCLILASGFFRPLDMVYKFSLARIISHLQGVGAEFFLADWKKIC